MTRKVVLGLAGLLLVALVGLTLWVRAVLGGDAIRLALASQISQVTGQPVTIGGLRATIYPRIRVVLTEVAIGRSAEIQVQTLDVGTDFRALLSRRIEHAAVHVEGARITLPLPPLTPGASRPEPAPAASAKPPVELVSIDEVTLRGVEFVSGGRRVKADIDLVPQGKGVLLRSASFSAEDTSLTASGAITDLAGPVGEVAIKAGELNFDRLLAFATDFSTGVSSKNAPADGAATIPAALHISVAIDADRALMGGLVMDHVTGRMVARGPSVSVDPLVFGLFGGRYEGRLGVDFAEPVPKFHWQAALEKVDIAAAAAFAGQPNTASGMLSGRIDLAGRGSDAATAMKSITGVVRVEATDGIIRNLGIVRSVGAATALSLEGLQRASAGARDTDEPFSKLGATVTIADGVARTGDLNFEAIDLSLSATGSVQLDGTDMALRGRLQLSEDLSRQVHQKMLRLSQDNGRVTLPATITGPVTAPAVRVDTADIAKRALKNTVTQHAPNLFKRGVGSLMRKQ